MPGRVCMQDDGIIHLACWANHCFLEIRPTRMQSNLLCSESRTILNYAGDQVWNWAVRPYRVSPAWAWPCVDR